MSHEYDAAEDTATGQQPFQPKKKRKKEETWLGSTLTSLQHLQDLQIQLRTKFSTYEVYS